MTKLKALSPGPSGHPLPVGEGNDGRTVCSLLSLTGKGWPEGPGEGAKG